ncbi:DsbA family protein [Streptomyces sp. NBC_01218]|uniref:DsbA family protein n=1 Tax=unclassified Streptomyces TaxID=2593676 RepID=UPI0023B926DC|nr:MULTISPECIES: DsbA family protein [unclassified Streptomyces]WEH40993.1 DsbA family protein [Streptomyces sp. AM 2-1-1]WSQ52645.1 DsbA family protein [Streptomyces sp. NBC_01218]
MPLPQKKSRSRKPLLFGSAVVLAAALLGYVSYRATDPGPSPSATAGESARPEAGEYSETAKLARREPGDPLALGRTDALVVLVEYGDFQCGYCATFARDTEPALVDAYVADGTLRIEWRNFPIFGEESEAAARAAWAAGRQKRFWEFHRAAYAEGSRKKGFGPERLTALAKEAGVADLERFRTDLDSAEAAESVGRDQAEAYGLGATSTPSFLVNGRPLAGAQPDATFTSAIEEAAEAARTGSAVPTESVGQAGNRAR